MADLESYIKLAKAVNGEKFTRPLLVMSMEDATASNGKPYVKLGLSDGTGKKSINRFDETCENLRGKGVEEGSVVTVKLVKNGEFFNIIDISPCKDESITPDDFVKMPPIDCGVMYDEICAIIRASAQNDGEHVPLAELALGILEKNKEAYMTSSAAITMHHNIKGGLLYHSYRMMKSSDALCGVYGILDRELMVCGAALHDIGKIWEYDTNEMGDASENPVGVLYGHLYIGANYVRSEANNTNCPPEKVKLLVHMILSHHGMQEWGTVVCPATAEAFALHYIDNMDAKIYACEDNYALLEPCTVTEKRPFGLDNRIYKPGWLSDSGK